MRKIIVLSVAVVVSLVVHVPPALAQGTYTQIDVPGAIFTGVYAINDEYDIVGDYQDSGGNLHGFLLSGGIFTTLDVPGAEYTYATALNDVGQIVGGTDTNGFLYDISSRVFTTLQHPRNGSLTIAHSINNAGTIVGMVANRDLTEQVGFELNGTTYTNIKAPGATLTSLNSINNLGDLLVRSLQPVGTIYYLLHDGMLTSLGTPNGPLIPTAINDAGTIVGDQWREIGTYTGFVKQGNSRQSLMFPGSSATGAQGINNSGVVVGGVRDVDLVTHGFLWTPPADAAKK